MTTPLFPLYAINCSWNPRTESLHNLFQLITCGHVIGRSSVGSMKKRIKLEFFDRAGVKHTVALEGEVTTENVNHLLEYAEIMSRGGQRPPTAAGTNDSKISRLVDVINTRLADRSFDSREILQSYRETWGDDFTLGAVSTYLSRLVDRGILERTGSSSHWFYRLKPSPTLSQ